MSQKRKERKPAPADERIAAMDKARWVGLYLGIASRVASHKALLDDLRGNVIYRKHAPQVLQHLEYALAKDEQALHTTEVLAKEAFPDIVLSEGVVEWQRL